MSFAKNKLKNDIINFSTTGNQMLPKDICHSIGFLLTPKDILKLMLCSKKHFAYMTSHEFWTNKMKMDYPTIIGSGKYSSRELYYMLYNRKPISYKWTEILKSRDMEPYNIFEYFETKFNVQKFKYCSGPVQTLVRQKGLRLLEELKNQSYQLDHQRIEDEFKNIELGLKSCTFTRTDKLTLKTYELNNWVEVRLNFHGNFEHLICHRNNVTASIQNFCHQKCWPMTSTTTDISNMVTRRKVKFVSYFNDTNIIDMLSICTKDGREDLKGYDLLSVFVVIRNHRTNYFIVLGWNGHAFIESSDFSYSHGNDDESSLQFEFELDRILDMAIVFYDQYTHYGAK